MEKNRIDVSIDDIKKKYSELENYIKNIPGEFTHTHIELHEMKAAPSFHFRSVL